MPETSGLEIPGLLAQRGHCPTVIIVTACDTEENRAVAKQVRAAAFFHKPVDGQALLDAITWAVEGHWALQNTESDSHPKRTIEGVQKMRKQLGNHQ